MKITYISHSGFCVELENTILIFDYYKGDLPEFDPKKQIYVFSSHGHPDHFNEDIFELFSPYPNVAYILSDDIETSVTEGVNYIKANEEKLFLNGQVMSSIGDSDGNKSLKVRTLESTDLGVAFLVFTGGQTIFHAGDLHWWTWPGESKPEYQSMTDRFFAEVAKITKIPIDVAFLPLDPRQEDRFYWGFDYYMQSCDIKKAFPMHFWNDYSLISKFKSMEESRDYVDKIVDIKEEGQTFILE